MRTNLQKWGNSLAVRIPHSFVKETKMMAGTVVEMTLEKGKLVITPVKEADYTLEDLIQGVTKNNVHREIDLGGPIGREVW